MPPDEFDSIDWGAVFKEHYDNFDHPLNPDLKVRDFATAVTLATATKFGGPTPKEGHASPTEAGLFWKEFQAMDPPMGPQKYLETLHALAPLSWRYHKRAPSISEVSQHRDSDPQKVRQHFESLPATHWGMPDISAGDFVKAHTKAAHWSQEHMSRDPYAHEVAYFHHAGYSHQDLSTHYERLRDTQAERTAQQGQQEGETDAPGGQGQQGGGQQQEGENP